MRIPVSALPRQLKCPRCGQLNTIPDGAKPSCSNCGFGTNAAGAGTAAPAAAGFQAAPAQGYGAPQGYGTPQGYGAPPAFGAPNPQFGMATSPPKGQAVTAMVLGIASCCIWIIPFIGIFISGGCAIAAIVLGVMAMKKAKTGQAGGKGMAITGMILGIITLVFVLLGIILMLAAPGILNELCKSEAQANNPSCADYRTDTSTAMGGSDGIRSEITLRLARLPIPGIWHLVG